MAEQNVAYASQDDILESLVLHTLPDFGPHGDGIINQNLLLAYLKGKGSSKSFKVKDGGLEIWKGVRTKQSSNFKWQGKSDTMNTNEQDPDTRMRFDWKTFTGSVVLNSLDKARNKGRAAIKDFALELREQANDTIMNQFNSAFWKSSPTSDEPSSLPSIISTTPTTGTIGGATRSASKALQNGLVDDTITDIGSEAGIKALKQAQIRQTIRANDMVDLIIMDEGNYSGLVGYLATQNRFMPNDKMADLNMDTIKLGKTTIGFENTLLTDDTDNTITAGYVYGINSNHLTFEVLKEGNFMWNPDGFERVGGTLNKALYFWVFCNLVTNLPKAHFVMNDVSTA